jgi:hypothetical protein
MNTVPSVCSVVSSAPQKVVVPHVMISDAAPILASSVIIPETKQKQSHFHISCLLSGRHRTVKVAAMVDSGATALFLDKKYADRQNMWQIPLEHPITLYNIDGSLNEAGSITHKVRLSLKIGSDKEKFDFFVTSLGPEKVILGLPWLRHRNPAINWQAGTMRLNSNTDHTPEEPEVEVTCINANRMECRGLLHDGVIDSVQDKLFCLAGFTYSQQITARATEAKGKRTFEEMVPEHYRDFAKVFSEEESQRLPQHQSWDHAIDFEPGAVTHWKVRTYPMAPLEQEELDKFLAEHLAKGYIEPSTSPMSSPVFFIRKADGRYRLVQDYRHMNKITIKNKTPLPLAADIINHLTGAQYFTKFDIRWGYHNIHIREGDEWKAAFSTNCGLFQPKVMYFGLTNSPATFQSLMNSIFADLIAKSEVAVYMDDILVYSSDLEHHCKIVREVLSRLQKYDLYL